MEKNLGTFIEVFLMQIRETFGKYKPKLFFKTKKFGTHVPKFFSKGKERNLYVGGKRIIGDEKFSTWKGY
jgi:hypothetical protein